MPVKRPLLTLLLVVGLCTVAHAQSAEDHAGKPILRDSSVAALPAAPGATHTSIDLDSGRVVTALAAVVGLILLLRWAAKKTFPAVAAVSRQQVVKVLARCPLAPRQQVILLQVGRRIVVAAESASQLSSLCQITDPDEVAALLGELQREKPASVASSFTSWFVRHKQAFGTDGEDAEPAELTHQDMDPVPNSEADGIGLGSLTDKVRQITREFKSRRSTP
jgi:flagellar biogenesis protein FliO